MSLEKKQRLSKDLTKSYIAMLFIYIAAGVIISLSIWGYLKAGAKTDVKFTVNFLKGEFMEDEIQSPKQLYEDIKEELPYVEGIAIGIRAGGKEYRIGDIPDLDLEYIDRIKHYDNYKYYIYYYNIPAFGSEDIDILVVKKMEKEIDFMYYLIEVYMISTIIMLSLVYLVYRYFYKKIIPQLKDIEGITNSINLESFNVEIDKFGYYEEFDNILSSYENMLSRLENQTSAHIDFVHNASHELKTPIFVIKGYSDILDKWGMDNKEVSREAIETIGREVRSMQSLTEKLLFLAKGKGIKPTREVVDIEDLIEEIEEELSHKYKNFNLKKITVEMKYRTDRDLLKILVKNIIENAIKYGLGKKIEIECIFRESIPVIIVKDNGLGMSQEDLGNIFVEFYRGNKSRSKKIDGHGLGMSIVKNIKEVLYIDIEIKSELDRGTSVDIILKDN